MMMLFIIVPNVLQLKEVGDFTTNVHTNHTLQIYEKLSYEALNRQFLVGAVIGWRSCLSCVTTIFMWSVSVICRVLFCLACVSGVLFFLKRWKFSKNNFSFGLALQTLLKTLVLCWLLQFLIVLSNYVGFSSYKCSKCLNLKQIHVLY